MNGRLLDAIVPQTSISVVQTQWSCVFFQLWTSDGDKSPSNFHIRCTDAVALRLHCLLRNSLDAGVH